MRKRNRFSALMSLWRPRATCPPTRRSPNSSGQGGWAGPSQTQPNTGDRHGSPHSRVLNTNTFICRVKTAYTSVSALSWIFCRVRLKISRLRYFLSGQVLSFRRPALLQRRVVWRRPTRSLTLQQPRQNKWMLHLSLVSPPLPLPRYRRIPGTLTSAWPRGFMMTSCPASLTLPWTWKAALYEHLWRTTIRQHPKRHEVYLFDNLLF